MAFKFLFAFCLFTVACAGVVPVDPRPTMDPSYRYSYGVVDPVTGDNKDVEEERDGDVVRGQYTLIDADGYRRIVQYTADPINGFVSKVTGEASAAPPTEDLAKNAAAKKDAPNHTEKTTAAASNADAPKENLGPEFVLNPAVEARFAPWGVVRTLVPVAPTTARRHYRSRTGAVSFDIW